MTRLPRRPSAASLRRRLVAASTAGAASLALGMTLFAGCTGSDKPQFRNTDITGAEFARELSLTGHDGKPYTLESFRGKVVVVFFGYTQCPDVCPTTMAEMADVMKVLGPDADRVQVLFVTIDPERDTPELLSHYVPAFDPRFLGLYGDADATARTAREFKVFYQKVAGSRPGTYTMDHTAGSYVFDTQGKVRLFVKHAQGPDLLARDIKLLLGTKPAS